MSRSPNVTFWQAMDLHPPYLVRLLAKKGREEALSDAEIAIAAGIPLDRIREMKMMVNYDKMTYAEMKAYFAACRFDPTNAADRQRIWQYNHKCQQRQTARFQYCRKHPKFESEILPVMKLAASPPMAA